jgi:hypothetical protein
MSAHTPSPWHWDSDPIKGDPLGRVRYRVTTTGKTITQCYYNSSDAQAEWDARLIAAAPDLLDALQALDADWSSFWPLGPDVPASGDRIAAIAPKTAEIWRKVRAAIAKATGAQQ